MAINIDFDDSITNLEGRARKARSNMMAMGLMLMLMIQGLVLLIFNQYQDSDKRIFRTEFGRSSRSAQLESSLEKRGAKIIESLMSQELNQAQTETAKIELEETVKMLNSFQKSSSSNTGETSFGANWATIAFSVGAVGFVVLLIQIAVQFMRYYARLAELYAAQANALRASNGDPEVAFVFIQHFSPSSVDIGKGPSTVYEKAFDTIKAVVEKK